MLTVGVGNGLNNPPSIDRLVAVTGPQVVRDASSGITSINQVDVALVTDFDDLAAVPRARRPPAVFAVADDPQAGPIADQQHLPTHGRLVDDGHADSARRHVRLDPARTPRRRPRRRSSPTPTGSPSSSGTPQPAGLTSLATVQEAVQTGYTAGRPGLPDFTCELKNQAGTPRTMEGELTVSGNQASFTLPTTGANIGEEIVTCTVWNSFNYTPVIAITKTNIPTAVRGDLDPPAIVTSNYAVTNPGNTPLSNVFVLDDKCATVTPVTNPGGFNVGDVNSNHKLDLPETWAFTCPRAVSGSPSPLPGAQLIVNEATTFGTDPRGTTVTATDTDDVELFFPDITLTKLVNGEELVIVDVGTPLTYTYAVTNTGDTPLGTVTLMDDTPPCESPTPDPGNTAPPLLPGQTWNYECGPVAATTSVINTADVSGVPLNPTNLNQPFPPPNPVVTATDKAEVDVISPAIDLTKSADARPSS